MGIEMGASLQHVYLTEDNLNGLEKGGLEQARDLVRESIPESAAMVAAIERVLDSTSTDIVDEMHAEGDYLMASSAPHSGIEFPQGLIHLRGENMVDDEFMVVRMGLWTPEVGFTPPNRPKLPWRERDTEETIRSMLSMGFGTADKYSVKYGRWGIPINRLTEVTSVHPQYNHIQGDFIHGHREDLLAINRMNIDEGMKEALIAAAKARHQEELAEKESAQTSN